MGSGTVSRARMGLVFTAGDGRRIDEANHRRRILDPACVRAGIPPIRLPVLRHTHGSIVAAEAGTSGPFRGDSSPSASFSLETYVHLLDDRAGVDAVVNVLGAGSGRSGA